MIKSEIALGCWQFGGSFGFWENQERSDSLQVLHAALRSNIRHFDTAATYANGKSEQILGQQIKRFSHTIGREELTITSKIMPKGPALVRKDVQKSLDRLCLSYLDILYLHWPSSSVALKPILDAMAELKAGGLVKALGLSNFPLPLLASLSDYPISYVQMPCSLLWTKGLDAMRTYCTSKEIGLVGYSPLGLGLLNGSHLHAPDDGRANIYVFKDASYPAYCDLYAILHKCSEAHHLTVAQTALAWARGQGFGTLLIGARNKGQLLENLSASDVDLSEGELAELDEGARLLAMTAPPGQDNLFGHRW